jgi:hypothetical protein
MYLIKNKKSLVHISNSIIIKDEKLYWNKIAIRICSFRFFFIGKDIGKNTRLWFIGLQKPITEHNE